MLSYGQIIGTQEDWANFVTNVEMEDTPFLDWLPAGDKPVNVQHLYQAEVFRDPAENSHINGRPITGFKSAGDSRGVLKALVQYFTQTSSVTKLHQDVTDIAGIPDELASDIAKGTKELAFDMETAFLEDDDHREDNSTVGYKTRGVGSWISTAAQSLYPVPASFRPPTASVSTTATASLTENTILDILESIGTTTKSRKPITVFAGPKLARAFNGIALFTPASTLVGGTPTGATGVVHNQNGVRTVDRVMERYNSDFGPIQKVLSYRQVKLGGNSIEQAYTGYFLHQDMWQLRWNQKPEWRQKEYEGGAYEAFCEAICMLVCKNPKGEGKYQPTS